MLKISKIDIKIFLSFFFLYLIFIHWSGAHQNSSLALIKSVADNARIQIDNYANQTEDRAYYQEHYYSDKPIGTPFLMVPTYINWKFINTNFLHLLSNENNQPYSIEKFNNTEIITYLHLNSFDKISIILVTVFSSVLFSSINILLFGHLIESFVSNKRIKYLSILTYGLATMTFPYALLLMEYVLGSFFMLLSFIFLTKCIKQKIVNFNYIFATGLFAGLAFICDYSTILTSFVFGLFYLIFRTKRFPLFAVAFIIGVLPMLLYNFIIFGNVFDLTVRHLDPSIWSGSGVENGLGLSFPPNLFVVLRFLVYPERGLFFYHPILIFSIVGIIFLLINKKLRILGAMVFLILLLNLLYFSSYKAWYGHAAFGPRRLYSINIFLSFALVFVFKKINWRFLLPFIFISVLINFIGLQHFSPNDFTIPSSALEDPLKITKVNSFQIVLNPLFDYYLPRFLKSGPCSILSEALVNGNFDIRYKCYENGAVFYSIALLFAFLLIIWKDEIEFYRYKNYLFLFAFLLLFAFFVRI